jgi:hypothetical protein
MLAIVKEMQKEAVGNKKTMGFTVGYGDTAPGRPHTSLSGRRSLVPSALIPSYSTAASYTPLLLYPFAISCAFR